MTTPTFSNSLQEKATTDNQASIVTDQHTGQFLNSIKLQANKRLKRSAAKALLGFMGHFMDSQTRFH